MSAQDMFLAVPLLLALRFPGAWPELSWVMIMLLLRRCFVAAHGGSEGKNPNLEAVELEDVKPQLVLQVGFIIFIGISKFFVNYAPWLCEASCAVLILHLLWTMVTPQSSPPPTTVEAPAKAKTKPSAPRDHDSVAVPAVPPAAEKVGPKAVEPKGKKPGGVLDVSLWADLEEEDEFQEVLAAKLQSEAVPSAASKAAPPVAPKEEAGSADVIEDEVPRPKRKAKAKKVREGANVRKEETPNPWAARIRSCGKAKDLEGALQAVEEVGADAGGSFMSMMTLGAILAVGLLGFIVVWLTGSKGMPPGPVTPLASVVHAKGNPHVFFEVEAGGKALGRIEFELFKDVAPMAVENFRALCTGEKGPGLTGTPRHFKGSPLHRIIPGFMAQGGDITHGNGRGGESIYGKTFRDEWEHGIIHHTEPGLLSMANRGRNSNGSQFFITFSATPWLDGKHVVFGRVIFGMDIVKELEKRGSRSGTPTEDLKITDSGELGADGKVLEEKPSQAAEESTSVPSL